MRDYLVDGMNGPVVLWMVAVCGSCVPKLAVPIGVHIKRVCLLPFVDGAVILDGLILLNHLLQLRRDDRRCLGMLFKDCLQD